MSDHRLIVCNTRSEAPSASEDRSRRAERTASSGHC